MEHISEPKEVDFIIQSPTLLDKERKELSEFIKGEKQNWEKNLLQGKSQARKKSRKHSNLPV